MTNLVHKNRGSADVIILLGWVTFATSKEKSRIRVVNIQDDWRSIVMVVVFKDKVHSFVENGIVGLFNDLGPQLFLSWSPD